MAVELPTAARWVHRPELLLCLDTAWAKQQLDTAEMELKGLKEQQKRARPLPARLQATTDRLAKFTAAEAEVSSKVEVLQDK